MIFFCASAAPAEKAASPAAAKIATPKCFEKKELPPQCMQTSWLNPRANAVAPTRDALKSGASVHARADQCQNGAPCLRSRQRAACPAQDAGNSARRETRGHCQIGAAVEQAAPGFFAEPLCLRHDALVVHGQDLATPHDPAAIDHHRLDV